MILCEAGKILSALCKGSGKWGMFCNGLGPGLSDSDASAYDADLKEIEKAAPWITELSDNDRFNLLMEDHGFLLFDTQEEMETTYQRTVGDDGPTKLNPYTGPWRIYCLTCDPTGQLRNENT